jgi:hypothetical protein
MSVSEIQIVRGWSAQPRSGTGLGNFRWFWPNRLRPDGWGLIAVVLFGFLMQTGNAHPVPLPQDLIEQFDGKIIRGTLTQIGPEGQLQGTGIPANVQLNDVAKLRLSGRETSPPAPVLVQLVNGSQIRGERVRLEDETLELRTIFGPQQIPLKLLRGVVWKSTPGVEQLLRQPETVSDSAVVQTEEGERTIQGMIEGISGDQLSIQFQNQSRKIALNRLNAIVMADLGWELSADRIAVVNLIDGSIGSGKLLEVAEGTLQLEIDSEVRWSIPWNQVSEISFRSDRLVFLSDLDPVSVQQQTIFVLQRPWQRDRSISGNRLVLRNPQQELVEFNRGLGTQAFTRLDFANSNDYRRFLATVGIAAETNGKGDCLMVVQGDGRELWSQRLRGSDPPREIDVDITGMRTVSLIVYPGEEYDLADHANWCDARFIK